MVKFADQGWLFKKAIYNHFRVVSASLKRSPSGTSRKRTAVCSRLLTLCQSRRSWLSWIRTFLKIKLDNYRLVTPYLLTIRQEETLNKLCWSIQTDDVTNTSKMKLQFHEQQGWCKISLLLAISCFIHGYQLSEVTVSTISLVFFFHLSFLNWQLEGSEVTWPADAHGDVVPFYWLLSQAKH